jgi:hypothetical protein
MYYLFVMLVVYVVRSLDGKLRKASFINTIEKEITDRSSSEGTAVTSDCRAPDDSREFPNIWCSDIFEIQF